MTITLETMSSFCRTCLNVLETGAELDIHNTPNVAKWLIVCTSMDFEKNDGYPNNICETCYSKIKASYEFRVMCIKSTRELDGVINAFPKLEIDRLELDGACADLNSPQWLQLANKIDVSNIVPIVHKQEEDLPVEDQSGNSASNANNLPLSVLEEQEIDHNDIFSGLIDDSTDYDSTPEQDILDGVEESAMKKNDKPPAPRRGRKPKEEDYTMPAYIKTPEIYNCEKCRKKFFKKDRFDAHIRLHEGLKPYPCKLCDKTYNKSSHLKVHMMDVHTEHKEEFKCDYEGCNKVFRRKQTLRVHCRIKHSEVKYEPKIFICEECGKTFRNIGALRDHRFRHTGEEFPYKCEQCGKGYVSQRTYRDHLMRHAGIKNFVCPYCGLRKTTKSELRIHINYHTKEKQWPCPACPQVFNSSANLGLHNRIVHKGIRRFKCRFCDQSFGKAETLKHHEMRHTGEKPHECTICGKRFIQVVALRAHLKTHNKAT